MSLNIVVTADVAAAGKQIDDFSKKSRIALNSLSLVAQDLPFGFIGIQNNLPGVISSFGELTKEAGGVGGAVKQLSSSLVGPAGLFLAFSVVTAGATFLIQKYGSLGNAVNVLTSSNKAATIAQLAFNKAILEGSIDSTAESAKINILVKTLTNLKAPLADRLASYDQLKKIQPQILGGISEENSLNEKSAAIINNLAQQRKDYVRLRIQENAINGVLNKNAAESLVLEEKVLGAAKQLSATIEKRNKLSGRALSAREQETLLVLIEKEKAQTKTLKDLTNEYNTINGVTQSYLDKLDPLVIGIAKYDKVTRDLSESLKKQKKDTDSSAMSFYKYNGKLIGQEAAFSKFVVGQTNLQVKAIDKLIASRVKYRKETSLEKATELVPKVISTEAKIVKNQKFLDTQAIAAEFALAKELIDGVFFNPIAESFENFINTGKFTFDEFAKNIKANIAKIVAQIAASKIVELLGTIFAGPIAGGLSQGGGFLSAIGSILPAFRANTRFEGVRPLGLGGGQKIDLVLRGTDLVGSINRTNSQISRVG